MAPVRPALRTEERMRMKPSGSTSKNCASHSRVARNLEGFSQRLSEVLARVDFMEGRKLLVQAMVSRAYLGGREV